MWKTFSESTELWIHMLTLACHFSSCWFSIKSCRRLISAVIPLTRNWPVDTFILTHSVYSKKQAKSPVFTPRSRLASDLQIPCLAKVALSGLRQAGDEQTEGDGATEKFSEGSRAGGMRGCKDEEEQIKMRGREGRMVKKKKKEQESEYRGASRDETSLHSTHHPLLALSSSLSLSQAWLNLFDWTHQVFTKSPLRRPPAWHFPVMDGMRGLGPLWISVPVIFCHNTAFHFSWGWLK